jgi:site-specific recombinase XerD
MMRHSCAVALLQAGVDVSVIRDYLGHASVATTSRYITTNLQMKREVLDAFWKRAGLAPTRARKWQPSPKLLAFLQQL